MTARTYRLPTRLFLYHVDQVADMLGVSLDDMRKYLWYDKRSTGIPPVRKIRAVNMAPSGEPPEWRIEEAEFVRWARAVGFRSLKRKEWA